jgi:hypothetical protein
MKALCTGVAILLSLSASAGAEEPKPQTDVQRQYMKIWRGCMTPWAPKPTSWRHRSRNFNNSNFKFCG